MLPTSFSPSSQPISRACSILPAHVIGRVRGQRTFNDDKAVTLQLVELVACVWHVLYPPEVFAPNRDVVKAIAKTRTTGGLAQMVDKKEL